MKQGATEHTQIKSDDLNNSLEVCNKGDLHIPIEPHETTWKYCPNLWWNRPPPEILKDIEEKFIQRCSTPSVGWYVSIPPEDLSETLCIPKERKPCLIWTRKFTRHKNISRTSQEGMSENDQIPLVMVHGLAAGEALFALNFDGLAKHFTIYAIDLPGFARSSRYKFSQDPIKCEEQYLSLLEKWRESVGIKRMNMLGHSFGGYLSTSYALKFPERINHLILADPWGFNILPPELERGKYVSPSGRELPWWLVLLFKFFYLFNPLATFRLGGRWSYRFIKRMRSDILQPFNILWDNEEENLAADYLHQANLHTPSGEKAFRTLGKYFFWSKFPLINRINELDSNIPLTAIYGGHSWMPKTTIEELEHARNAEGYNRSRVVPDAGHHVYANFEHFNYFVIKACQVFNRSAAPDSVQ